MPQAQVAYRQKIAEKARRQALNGQADGRTQCASGQAEDRRLPEVEAQQLVRLQAETTQCRYAVHSGGQPGSSRLRRAHAAEQQGQQGHQGQEALDALHPSAEGRLRLGVGLDAEARPVAQDAADLACQSGDGLGSGSGGQSDQHAVLDAAAELLQPGSLEAGGREKDPRTRGEGPGDPIGLG